MFMRVDRLQAELPKPDAADPNAASVVQELMGGKFGELSTLNNYLFQSFNFKGKDKLSPFYQVIASITAEELGHVELVANSINLLLNGPREDGEADVLDPTSIPAPFEDLRNVRNTEHFIAGGMGSLPFNSMGRPWNGENVFSSGNMMLDLLHNFFLESGARLHKLRVYEMSSNPAARALCGYLLVRGGVHQLAYARALEELSGVEIPKMLPMPNIPTAKIPESAKYLATGEHTKLYRFSPNDFKDLAAVWHGTHPEDGSELIVVDGIPEGAEADPNADLKPAFAPDYEPEELIEIAQKLMKKAQGF